MRCLLIVLVFLSCAPPSSGQSSILQPAFPSLSFSSPVDVQSTAGAPDVLFVVERSGRILHFPEHTSAQDATVFLDIRGRVVSGGERGLLGLAFHPRYPDSAYVYVNYTAPSPLRTVVSRFTVDAAGRADAATETILLAVNQPFTNHNAGQLQFGPDAYLYVGMGDGGSGGDPNGNGQNLSTLLGSILRLDVDGGGQAPDCGGSGAAYTIPTDNPFAGSPDACAEIYAYGLRNPWRFSFGPDGTLFVADVGQGRREEVNVVTAGGNYGWNAMEGSLCYPSGNPCAVPGTTLPAAEYPHDAATGGFSITGGYVYTGTETGCAPLRNRYVYGDYVSGNLWSLGMEGNAPDVKPLAQNIGISVSTFGVGTSGVLYLADLDGGALYRLDCNAVATAATVPASMSPFSLSAPAPNPTRGTAHLTLTGLAAAPVTLRVYDALGRATGLSFDAVLSGEGAQALTFDLSSLPSGTYFVRAQVGVQVLARVVTVAR